MGSENMEVAGNLGMNYLDEQVNTKEHGRKESRDFKIRQAFGGILCKAQKTHDAGVTVMGR